jgi:hypothetical protein
MVAPVPQSAVAFKGVLTGRHPEKGAFECQSLGAPSPLLSRFVVRLLNNKRYLRTYLSEGSLTTENLSEAKLFDADSAKRTAELFEVERVLCDSHGREFRTAVLSIAEQKPLPPVRPVANEAREIFLEFVGKYLGGVKIIGVQPGFKHLPDSYLFNCPKGSTLSVPTNVMLLDRPAALAIVAEKLRASEARFQTIQQA